MDALFFFRHSVHGDFEIRHSLRGIAKHAPWIRKVWIFGDRPEFLSDDNSLIEHVAEEYIAGIGRYRVPITNFFLSCFLSSLIPDLADEYLLFSDDFFTIGRLTIEEARKDRYIVDMDKARRQTGLWNDSLWRTYDFLKRLGYICYNFEAHAPMYLTKRRVFEAYCDLKDYVTQDRWFGLLGPTAILNHAVSLGPSRLVHRDMEGKWVGFHLIAPPYEELVDRLHGKIFLNCDDRSLSESVRRYLAEAFPDPCIYERLPAREAPWPRFQETLQQGHDYRTFPSAFLSDRSSMPGYLSDNLSTGAGVIIGPILSPFMRTIIEHWNGQPLHCLVAPPSAPRPDSVIPNEVAGEQTSLNESAAVSNAVPPALRNRCKLYWMPQADLARRFPHNSLDVVYFEGDRDRETVVANLETWYPKVRKGGILAGYGYVDCTLSGVRFQVKTAVDHWASAHKLRVKCTGEPFWRSWLIKIPEAGNEAREDAASGDHLT